MTSNKKILLIGGGGFIGLNLAMSLYQNYQITIFNRYNENLNKLKNNYPKIHFIEGVINDLKFNLLLKNNFDYIIWLAHSSVPASNLTLVENINCDITPLEIFLGKLLTLEYKPEKFIYFSSGGTIYGNTETTFPISEENNTHPISIYGLVKLVAENLIRQKTQEYDLNVCILRPSNVYGEFQNLNKPQGIIIHAFNSLLMNRQLPIYNNGNIIRDFINIKDLTECIEKLLLVKFLDRFQIFNISSSKPIKIIELLNLIEKITYKKLQTNFMESRNFDCYYNVLDNNKIKKFIDWEIEIPLEKGLIEMWNKINNNEN